MSTSTIIIVLALVVLFFFATTLILGLKLDEARGVNLYIQNKSNPFKRRKRFLSGNEKKLFNTLNSIDDLSKYYIFPQLHLSTLFEVKEDVTDMAGKFDRINRLYVDFVIFDSNLNPILVIELNDSTHKWNSRKARDEFVNKVCNENKLPLITFETNELANTDTIRRKVFKGVNNHD